MDPKRPLYLVEGTLEGKRIVMMYYHYSAAVAALPELAELFKCPIEELRVENSLEKKGVTP